MGADLVERSGLERPCLKKPPASCVTFRGDARAPCAGRQGASAVGSGRRPQRGCLPVALIASAERLVDLAPEALAGVPRYLTCRLADVGLGAALGWGMAS